MPTKRPASAEFQSQDAEPKKHKATAPANETNGKGIHEPTQNGRDLQDGDVTSFFSKSKRLFDGPERQEMTSTYSSSTPYRHIIIPDLMDEKLLSDVRSEILTHLHFTPKQTDIYSVSQTGDLANLSGLDSSELDSLPSLLKLRNALYSKTFRDFLCAVTGVKALSGTKTDMSINKYEKGGHLLTHDDVIGTRSVSYILYLVEDGWKEEWGGGLRLYKTSEEGVPDNEPSLTIPPKWNQMAMFAVQPGKSFHDVEEVYKSESPRLAISGWFHTPQEGEEGYTPVDTSIEERALSSLEQLTSIREDKMWSFTSVPEEKDSLDFTEDDLSFLTKYINEVYLTPDVVEQLHESMADESLLEIPDFLTSEIANPLHTYLSEQDESPTNEGWDIAGPPHKQRFRYSQTGISPASNPTELFLHPAFRKWLYHVTGLEITAQRTLARHFRPGSDYTLATELTSPTPQLEATLSLTPSSLRPKFSKVQGIGARAALSNRQTGWSSGEFGGYEVYLAPNSEEDNDPAVYKSAETDDAVLVSSDASWNVFTLVLRDTGVLKFVKYVSKSAWGGRWDITSEWQVKAESFEADT